MRKQWTPAEDALLGTMIDKEVAKLLKVHLLMVYKRRRKLGIKACWGIHKWTPAEDALLGKMSDTALGKYVGTSPDSVKKRRDGLGIPGHPPSMKSNMRYNPEQLRVLLVEHKTYSAVAKVLGISRQRAGQLYKRIK